MQVIWRLSKLLVIAVLVVFLFTAVQLVVSWLALAILYFLYLFDHHVLSVDDQR